ncbi:hypothetical protein StoSoilB13_37830 (plasmid) [Arthrobacter sp. StoSoilB13]|nr:hypothetical protein StoSoilB13_37830 [Arthrobacter sp. StoSoilB13]
MSGNQVKPGPMGIGARREATTNPSGSRAREAEEIVLIGAIAVQQHQKRLALPFSFVMGPQDNGRGECNGFSHGSILAVTDE